MQNRGDLSDELSELYSRVSLECKTYLESDPHVTRQDTCKGLLALLEQLRAVLIRINGFKTEERARNYHITYNAVSYILELAEFLKKIFSFEIIPVLMEALKALEENLILADVKYLDKRTELYLFISKIYEQWQNYQEAVGLLDSAIKSYKNLKSLHEQDPPVPNYVLSILNNNTKIIKVFFIKYSIQAGSISPADWRKRVDEELADDTEIKLMCLIECLKTETKKHANIFVKTMKNYKENLLQSGYDMVKPHLEILSKGLSQQKEKIEREVTFKSNSNNTQVEINQEIKKKRQVEDKFIKESEIKKASEACPLQYHSQLIHYALQMKSSKIINELLEYAQVRIECRRIEVPYINDVMITVSNSPYPNVPNGYTKIPVDLNEANLIKQLTKLRKSGKKAPEEQQIKGAPPPGAPPVKEEKKDSKKPGKEPQNQPPPVAQEKDLNREPSEWELNEIKHKYVFMMIKKSMSAQGALYNLGVVMGNEEKGPVGFDDNRRIIVPYIQENMKVIESQVKQYTGVRQTTGLVPYVILYHSRNQLESEQEMKTVITDVTPLIGKNPMVPAKWGYKKIDVDLRQVPPEFIKAPNHDYVYLTYKTDEFFHISQRHIQIIKAFVDLEASWGQKKSGNNEEQKWIEVEINYEIDKLGLFFETVQQALKGELGQEYYRHRCDFLTTLTFELWSKYLKNPLLQLDYMREQRLNGQIIDYDYDAYRGILERCSPIFLRGLKVLNLIMVNNQKGDILLQSKINLELAKLLQESKLYKMAAENVKLCLAKLRKYRDEYLAKGVQGSSDKLLPFSVTCSNAEIKRVIVQMRKKYHEQRREIEKKLRIRERRNRGEKPLSSEQLLEEEKEFIRFRKSDVYDETIEKVGTSHSQVYSIVTAIQLDLINLYFRISLKRSEELATLEMSKNNMTNGIKNEELEGLASTLKKKLTLNQGPTQTKNIQNLSQLQNTLVKANQLPPPRPKLQKMQAKLTAENKKNPYNMVLLMVNLAAQNSDNKDKRYYLDEALRYLTICSETETRMMSQAIDNAIFIFSGLWDSKIVQDKNSEKVQPFIHLFSNIWQEPTDIPEAPILIAKNSTSIQLKLPPFVPRRRSQKEEQKVVKFMSIYGKASANGVDVSLNCVQLQGTGIRKEVGKTVKVSSLEPNNLYCFAAGAIDSNEDSMGIGRTGEDIGTFNPLSIPMLASYLAKISYQINEYQIAEKAVDFVIKEYCKEGNFLTKDERTNNLYYYNLNEERIRGVSLLEIKSISEAFYIAALCQRRNLISMKEEGYNGPKISLEEKQKLITNLLMLAGCLAPSLSSPNMSIPFLIPESQVLQRAILISMIPDKWMNPKIRKLGISVMSKLLKWGLQNNQISMARKLVYKWNERKYILLGKTIQIQEKKEVKKGAKDAKDQEVKMVDKYCRMMIEKSPQLMDTFEDSIITISEEYYDYVGLFIQRAKEQIALMGQYVDNPVEQLDAVAAHLSSKLQLIENLREPIQSIKKVGNTSPYYYEHNSKILKKAMEVATEGDFKTLIQKVQELDVPDSTQELKLAKDIYNLIFDAIKHDIEWTPSSKLELVEFQKNTGKDLSKAIQIYSNWEVKKKELNDKLIKVTYFKDKFKDFDYLNLWIGQLYQLKAQCHVIVSSGDFEVKRKIKARYDKIRGLSLDDMFKKNKQVEVLDISSYKYNQQQLKKLTTILNYLCNSIYASLLVQNWLKMQSTLKFLCNFLAFIEITPFYHKKTQICIYFAFISLCAIDMLTKIRKNGLYSYKERYNKKLMNSELASISQKLQINSYNPEPLIEMFAPEYYQPDLQSSTTKSFWFSKYSSLDMEPISSVIAYTVCTLRLESKYHLVINIVRDFCNISQHCYSLELLPFMTSAQGRLLEATEKIIQEQKEELLQVTNAFQAEKQKMGKKRAYAMSGEKMPFEKEYEEKSQKINQSLHFLTNQKEYVQGLMSKSNRVKNEITRDSSKQALAQQQQRKYTLQFGEHYQQMVEQFGEDAKHVRKSKNFLKDIINKYDAIYEQLKNSKTTKDPLAEIQNRHQVGNLWFASGHIDKAHEFWNDALATIFRKVNPIEHYQEILEENRPYISRNIGHKEILLALCLLYKISRFTCAHKLQLQKAAAHFSCHLIYCLFQTSLEYPQAYLPYKDFRIKSFPLSCVFADEQSLNLTELLSALQYFTLVNLYEENYLSSLPLVSFYEYLGTDILKHTQTSVKAKIYKAIILAELGLVSEAITYLTKVANEKDLPVLWLDSSQFLKKEKGMNWTPETLSYNNTQFWTNAQNKTTIEDFKKIVMKPETSLQNGLINPHLFNYAKALTLFKIYQAQLCKDQSLNEQRVQVLGEVEAMMRECLKKTSVLQQFYSLLQQWQENRLLFKQNQVNDELKKQMEASKAKMLEYLKKSGVEDAQLKWYQRETSSAVKRNQRLQFICRIRYSLHKLYEAKNVLVNSYFTLKNGLTNIYRYSIGARLCETGFDPEIKAVIPAAAPTGKKDDKKGGKKEEEAPQAVIPLSLQPTKEKELKDKAQSKPQRTSLNCYWHLKLLFEIGRLLFKQNNFKQTIKIMEIVIATSNKQEQSYFKLHSQAFIARAKLRLGYFQPQEFSSVIASLDELKFYDLNYLNLVMDYGQLLEGQPSALEYLKKGKTIAENIWRRNGMRSILAGIGEASSPKNYYLKEQLTTEMQQAIKKKKKGEKKGGKDEKKGAAKKEDPKKKKEDNKIEYKVTPLSKLVEVNLQDEEKYIFGEYVLNPHPNYLKNNIYQPYALIFIRTYSRVLTEQIKTKKAITANIEEVPFLLNLLQVLESYPYPTEHIKIGLYSILGKIYKQTFLSQLDQTIKDNKLKKPFEDRPLNSILITLPNYSDFLHKKRELLLKARNYFKKSLILIENSTLLFERGLLTEEIAWEYSENECLLAEYVGRDKPKFYPEDQATLNSEEIKLQSLNSIAQVFGYLELAAKIKVIKFDLQRNYMEIGGKGLEATAKVDEDITSEIMEIDKQCKKGYSQFLLDVNKGKASVTATDLITYMLKVYRQSEYMTFSTSNYQNTIYKCHRILVKSLPQFKEKCQLLLPEIPLRKNIKEKFVEPEALIIQSSRKDDSEVFLYVVGGFSEEDPIYYGRVFVELHTLSKITEDLLTLTTKTALSDKKSEAVKERDYILHRKEFKRILTEISLRFGNPMTDGHIKPIEEEWLVNLTTENLKVMNKVFDSNGVNCKNKDICKYWRKLHEIKYMAK